MFSILETIQLGRSITFSRNKKQCPMFNTMCTVFQMSCNLIFQNQVCFKRLIRFCKINCIFVKISTHWNWYPYSISAMFHGNRANSYETVARKFRRSMAFEWQYFLQTATVSTTDAQRWRVVGTSVVGMRAAAIGRIFDIPEGQCEVYSTGRPYRVNAEGVKTSI